MKQLRIFLSALCLLLCCGLCHGQNKAYDVFTPITKYLAQGNSEALSAWFADNLQISVVSQESTASKSQAKQIVKSFFQSYTPRSFIITHTTGRFNMKYALGELNAGGEMFHVTIFVSEKNGTFKIQQLKIERS